MQPSQLDGFFAAARFLINEWTLFLAASIFVFFRTLDRVKTISDHNVYRRALPILPEVLGVFAHVAFSLPMNLPPGAEALGLRTRVALHMGLGLWSAYMAEKFRKILAQTVLGDDKRITFGPKAVDLIERESGDLPMVPSRPPSIPPSLKRVD